MAVLTQAKRGVLKKYKSMPLLEATSLRQIIQAYERQETFLRYQHDDLFSGLHKFEPENATHSGRSSSDISQKRYDGDLMCCLDLADLPVPNNHYLRDQKGGFKKYRELNQHGVYEEEGQTTPILRCPTSFPVVRASTIGTTSLPYHGTNQGWQNGINVWNQWDPQEFARKIRAQDLDRKRMDRAVAKAKASNVSNGEKISAPIIADPQRVKEAPSIHALPNPQSGNLAPLTNDVQITNPKPTGPSLDEAGRVNMYQYQRDPFDMALFL